MRFEKIMLVGAEIPPPVMELLLDTGSRVTKLPSGKTAVTHAQRELFDAAIIFSTGEEMDLAETVFNLRDINSSMQVIIVSDRRDAAEGAIPKQALARAVQNAKVMTMKELKKHFDLPQRG
jgi:DNA-binding NarL/FixJ family response regulator